MLSVPLTAKPSGERRCVCVGRHYPTPTILHSHHVWPLGEGGPDISANLLWLCPTTHNNAHELWRLLKKGQKQGINVPWSTLRTFSRYTRDEVVRPGWEQMVAAA